MKKLFAVFLCLCLLFCCGCGNSAVQPETLPSALPAETPEAAVTPAPAEAPAAPDPTPEEDAAPAEEAPQSDAPAFTFSTADRAGGAWDEGVFAEHKLTMINFWEPWCGPCVGEMPDLQALYEAYADQGFMILGVYSTPGMEDDVSAVLRQTGVTYPILQYCSDFDSFQSGYVPTTVFVDQQGHVLHRVLSPDEKSMLSDVIAQLGEEQTSALYIGSDSYEGWAAIIEGLL